MGLSGEAPGARSEEVVRPCPRLLGVAQAGGAEMPGLSRHSPSFSLHLRNLMSCFHPKRNWHLSSQNSIKNKNIKYLKHNPKNGNTKTIYSVLQHAKLTFSHVCFLTLYT